MNGSKPKKITKAAKKANAQAIRQKIASTQSQAFQSGQAKRKKAYAGKEGAVDIAKGKYQEYADARKNYSNKNKNSMSREQIVSLARQRGEMTGATAGAYDFDYKSTAPKKPLLGASKKIVRASKKLNQAGGRRPKR